MKDIPILLLHGWNLHAGRYTNLKNVLEKKGYNVFVPEMPGFGKETAPDVAYHLSDYVRFVEQYIQKQKLSKVIIIGHSFGGRVGIKLAVKIPHTVKMLILTGVPGYLPVRKTKVIIFFVLSKIGHIIFNLPILNFFYPNMQKILYRVAGATDYTHTNGTMRETFKHVIREDLVADMKRLSNPTILIWGKNDKIVSPVIGERMSKTIPLSKFTVIPNGKHLMLETNAEEFVSVMESFIRREL